VTPAAVLNLIKGLAPHHGLPWELVAAIALTESSMNPWAMRYEPQYKYLMGTEETLTATERAGQMISWGLMQVMGGVAREHGYKGCFPMLCEPTIGINYGCLHLKKFKTRYPGSWQDVIASYNAGRPVKRDGKYINQDYVDKVLSRWQAFENPIPLKESEV
jgi:soluble lytic murein transglycosylase-like protein